MSKTIWFFGIRTQATGGQPKGNATGVGKPKATALTHITNLAEVRQKCGESHMCQQKKDLRGSIPNQLCNSYSYMCFVEVGKLYHKYVNITLQAPLFLECRSKASFDV